MVGYMKNESERVVIDSKNPFSLLTIYKLCMYSGRITFVSKYNLWKGF